MKKLLLIFFAMVSLTFSDVYIPKNEEEIKILNNLKNKTLRLGLDNDYFYNEKIDGKKSINDLVKELLSDYLQLNVEYEFSTFDNLYSNFLNNDLDGIAFLSRNSERSKQIIFSESIFNEELYAISNSYELYALTDLKNKTIHLTKDSIYKKFLEAILYNNDLNSNFIETQNLALTENNIILTSLPLMFNPTYGIKVSNSSGMSFGINRNLKNFVPILNNALNDKYKDLIKEQIDKNNYYLSIKNLYSSFTVEEQEYLNSLKEVNVVYENGVNSILSYYSEIDSTNKGIAPSILKTIGESLNIKINDLTPEHGIHLDILEDKNLDIALLSKTKDREKQLLFSNKIYDIGTYVVSLKNKPPGLGSLGVVQGNIEELIALKYDTEENIKKYPDYEKLFQALNNNEVGFILTTESNFKQDIYSVKPFEHIPINFAFKKENLHLRSIIDKSMKFLISRSSLDKKAILEKQSEDLTIASLEKQRKLFFITVIGVLTLILLVILAKVLLYSKEKKILSKDPLTGLPNRNIFEEFCQNSSKYISGYTFIINIGNLKEINNKFGHDIGDAIIVEFSNFLKLYFTKSYIFRVSGEFCGIFFRDIEKEIKILDSYKKFCPLMDKYNASFSVGLYQKKQNTNLKFAFKYSDMALFEAKETKGFSYKIADEQFIKNRERVSYVLNLLKGDLKELYPVYQPKFEINNKKIIGGEALARCKSKKIGDIYPNEFIPVAEKFELIHKIDYKIAEETMKFVKTLIETNKVPNDFRISFNISLKTFQRDDLVPTIENLLNKYDISGKYFEIEITESILVNDMNDILNKLNSLIILDLQISLDDFTAGHSTAGLLPILPIDIVKFDKSLLDSIDSNEEKGKIVYESLTTLVKGLNHKIVAEGIETNEQLRFLKELNVEYGQGYLVSKPLPESDFIKFLNKNNI